MESADVSVQEKLSAKLDVPGQRCTGMLQLC